MKTVEVVIDHVIRYVTIMVHVIKKTIYIYIYIQICWWNKCVFNLVYMPIYNICKEDKFYIYISFY